MDFHRSLSDSKSPLISRTLLNILAAFNNAVVWIVSTLPPTSKSPSPFNNPLVTVPKAPFTIGIIVTMFHMFSLPLQGRGTHPSFHFLSVLFCDQPGQQNPQFSKFSLFLLIIIRFGLLAKIRWSVGMSKSQKSWVWFSRTRQKLRR